MSSNPTLSDVHINRALSDVAQAYFMGQNNYFALKAFPIVSVNNASDAYHIFSKDDFFRSQANVRAAGADVVYGEFGDSNDSYRVKNYVGAHKMPWETKRNADYDLESVARNFCMNQVLQKLDLTFASSFLTSGVWTTNTQGTTDFTKWDDASATPGADVDTQKAAVKALTGFEPNTMLISYDVFKALRQCPDVIDRIKYTSVGNVNLQQLAAYFDVDDVIIAGTSVNTAAAGAAASMSRIGTGQALLFYRPSMPSMFEPSAGYTFSWRAENGGLDFSIRTIELPEHKSMAIQGHSYVDMKLTGADLGVRFYDCIA